MKISLLLFLSALCALTISGSVPAADESVSVMSFNIRYGTAKDGENAWPHRRELVVETIQQRSPDILGLQESRDFQVEYLSEKLPEFSSYSVPRTPAGGESCAIFFRRDRFEQTDEGTFWLSEKPDEVGSISWDSSLPRIVSWLKLRSKTSDKQFLFANTHFDHKGPVARAESAKLLRRRLAEIAEELPVVITGDFNCKEGNAPYTTLTARDRGFRDTYREANPTKDLPNEITFTGFGLKTGEGRIDWILCSSHWTVGSAGIDRYRGINGRFPSDHEPVYSTLKW